MKYLFIVVLTTLTFVCKAQQKDKSDPNVEIALNPTVIDTNKIYTSVEVQPKFGLEYSDFNKYVASNLKYPTIAKENGIQGMVIVSFVVERNGTLSNIKIVKKLNDDCDLEALRLIKASPKWSPATISGKVVRCGYTFPVKFKLI